MIRETESLLNRIVYFADNGSEYYMLHGSDNKVWLIPQNNTRIGILIYSASSIKGIFIKRFFPLFARAYLFRKLFRIDKVSFELRDEFKSILGKLSDISNFTFYIGNTQYQANRKVIVQIADENRVLGYAKFGFEDIVISAFKKEINTLQMLNSMGISNIPDVVWNGDIGGIKGFIQSTNRTGKEKNVFDLKQEHWMFLKDIYHKTHKVINYRDSRYSSILNEFCKDISNSDWHSKEMLEDAIHFLDEYYADKEFEVCYCHGDFTPWNICYSNESFFVYDFEYGEEDFPVGLDVFHYLTQVGILCKNDSAEKIFANVMKCKEQLSDFDDNIPLAYLRYLLYIMAFYRKRMKNKLNESERSCRIWIRLIELCIDNGIVIRKDD